MSLATRARRYLQAKGPASAAAQVIRYSYRKAFVRDAAIVRHRKTLGMQLHKKFGGVVQAGPLKGLRLGDDPTWAAADLGPMLLGTYEYNVIAAIGRLSADATVLVDVGAADGYFGVGCLVAGMFDRSICFESDPISLAAQRESAQRNNVADRLTTYGTAGADFVDLLTQSGVNPRDALILVDIEGGEFALLDQPVLAALAKATFVIELHGSETDRAALAHRAADLFDISYIDYGPRDPNADPLLRDFIEDDRWLLCSEGRMINQRWMVLKPRL